MEFINQCFFIFLFFCNSTNCFGIITRFFFSVGFDSDKMWNFHFRHFARSNFICHNQFSPMWISYNHDDNFLESKKALQLATRDWWNVKRDSRNDDDVTDRWTGERGVVRERKRLKTSQRVNLIKACEYTNNKNVVHKMALQKRKCFISTGSFFDFGRGGFDVLLWFERSNSKLLYEHERRRRCDVK